MFGQLGGSDFLSNVLGQLTGSATTGNDVLGQVFGSKDVSRTVVDNAAQTSGLNVEQLKKMLPMLAMMVAGFMSKQSSSATGESAAGGGLLGGSQQASEANKSGMSGLISMLDLNGDGNPLDDIVRMIKK